MAIGIQGKFNCIAADGVLADSKQISGSYMTVSDITERNNLSSAIKVKGTVCYVRSEDQSYIFNGDSWEIYNLNNSPLYFGYGNLFSRQTSPINFISNGLLGNTAIAGAENIESIAADTSSTYKAILTIEDFNSTQSKFNYNYGLLPKVKTYKVTEDNGIYTLEEYSDKPIFINSRVNHSGNLVGTTTIKMEIATGANPATNIFTTNNSVGLLIVVTRDDGERMGK